MHERRNDAIVAALLGLGAAVACLLTGSQHLDDGDAGLFVAGIEEFDPTRNRPHPPGYPLYILLGKLVTAAVGDPIGALRAVSAAATGAAVALLPFFYRAAGIARRPAWALTALTAALPCFWLTGAKVLTDMPGFVAYLVSAIVLLRRPESGLGAGFLVGLLTGVRPHFLLALAPLLLARRPLPRLAGAAAGAGTWIGGTALVIGVGPTLRAANRQIGMRFERPGVSMFSPGEDLGLRAKHHAFELMYDALGVTPFALRMLACAALLLGAWAVLRDPRFARVRLLVVGAVAYGAFVFAFLPADPRYVLVAAPALAVIGTRADWRLAAALAVAIVPATVGRAILLRNSIPPPESALAWMNAQDPDHRVPYVGSQLFAHARVLDPARVGPSVGRGERLPHAFWITRRDLGWLGAGSRVEVVDVRVFERDATAHQKNHRVELLRCEFARDD